MRMTHERGDLKGVVALIHMDAAGIHHHGHVVDLAHEHLIPVARNGNRLGRESLNVAIRNMAHRTHALGEGTQAAAQHDGERMLDRGLAVLCHLLKRRFHESSFLPRAGAHWHSITLPA